MRQHPTWKTNLVICVALVALIGGYFFYQAQKASEQFRKNSREHSKVLAAAVELNIRNSILSNDGLELIITGFLQNSAEFISYLNTIERFTTPELSAFAKETGLAGITVVAADGEAVVKGPVDWGPELSCRETGRLKKHADLHLYTLAYAADETQAGEAESGCVIVGFSARDIEMAQREISVERLLERLSRLHGIASVRLVPFDETADSGEEQLATLAVVEGRKVSETRIRLGDRELIVAQEAGHFAKRLRQMQLEFFLFAAFLVVFGVMSSWWLYRSQRLRLLEAREHEQEIARQHEEAALGRAAATIAHEIRNPLNAIGMGLQRLQIETDGLADEHHALLVSMREAVKRSNGIVTSLQKYTRTLEVSVEEVDVSELLQNVLELYLPICRQQQIEVQLSVREGVTLSADRDFLGQVLENVIKNAVEAQPAGGFLNIQLQGEEETVRLVVQNGGFALDAEQVGKLFEPYFTSKTQGTGLGLSISKKIIEAHGGTIQGKPDFHRQQFTLVIELPRR